MSDPISISRFTKKPVTIQAMQWDGTVKNATDIINWILSCDGTSRYHDDSSDTFIMVDTLEGSMATRPGDWIINGVNNEFYPCKPDIFDKTYTSENPNPEPPFDNKYGKVTTEFGHFESGEPLFIFRAKDQLLPQVLSYYASLCIDSGSPARHIDGIFAVMNKVTDWQEEHTTKVPDSEASREWKN